MLISLWRKGSLLTLTLLFASLSTSRAAAPPNIVLIYCDDLGYADVGCYGNARVATPNIDRLAAQGVRFTDFYVAQPVCTASRAALLTGCYPNRIGLLGALPPSATIGINPNETTIAEMLKKRGYRTAIVGKWHLGHHPEFLPARHGFDEYLGLPYSNDMWPPNLNGKWPPLPLYDGEQIVDAEVSAEDQVQLPERYAQRAVKFIEQQSDEPFFLYLAPAMPHVPLFAGEQFRGKSGAGLYGDVLMEIDWTVGEILGALARRGLDEKTLVIFSSDNGPWTLFGDHAGSTGPLRGAKGNVFDGGVRVPCIMRWPGKIPAASTCKEVAATIDIFPTLARMVGGELPGDRTIDGKDIWPLIVGEAGAKSPHEALYFYWGDHLQAVRSGPWKMHVPHNYPVPDPPGSGGERGKFRGEKIERALFNLEAEIGEQTDVSAQHPEVVARLEALLEKCRADLGDTGRKGANIRPPGRLSQTPP